MSGKPFESFKESLIRRLKAFGVLVEDWHQSEPSFEETFGLESAEGAARFEALVMTEHLVNFRLWHVEDQARRRDVADAVIADCKRRIDRLNQKRNDLIEAVDGCLVEFIGPALPESAALVYNTETMGSALDRLSILSLKICHMREQTRRSDVSDGHVKNCQAKLEVLEKQFKGLVQALFHLFDEYSAGKKRPVVYRQFKMYNDPQLNPALYENL